MYAADCLILGTPVYYENVSAQMKAFIDRNFFPYAHDEWLRGEGRRAGRRDRRDRPQETLAALRRYVALSTDGDPGVRVRRVRGRGRAPRPPTTRCSRRPGAWRRELAAALGLSPA